MHEQFLRILLDVSWALLEQQLPFQRMWACLVSLTLEPAGVVSYPNIIWLKA